MSAATAPVWATCFVLLVLGQQNGQGADRVNEAEVGKEADRVGVQVAGYERFAIHGDIDAAMAGRLLISELGCAACHESSDLTMRAKPGPDLGGAGVRLDRDWVARFVADPLAVKPGTTMPRLLGGRPASEQSEIAEALAAYLSTLRKPIAEVKGSGAMPVPHQFWLRGDADRGRILFHQVGCVACHAPDPNHETVEVAASATDQLLEVLDEDELAELGLAGAARPGPIQSLGDPASKYSAHSLTSFLLDPDTVRPSGRMPNLKLSPTEAADLAAYLIRDRSTTDDLAQLGPDAGEAVPPAVTEESIAQGRDWFVKLRCGACHSGAEPAGAEAANGGLPALVRLDRLASGLGAPQSCVAGHPEPVGDRSIPQFTVDSRQRDAMLKALESTDPLRPDEALKLSMLQMNCFACHERDAIGGVARDRRAYFETVDHADLGDEGRFPPPLASVEAKLQPAWLNRVLQGTGTIRPHMHARMPKLAAEWVKRFAGEFQAVHEMIAVRPQTDPKHRWPEGADLKATDVGRAMMDSGCVQCHLFRGESLPGVIGVDLGGIGDRMRPDWFLALLRDPGAVKPRTRMPNFFPDGVSQHPDWLGGDRDRQIAAMWGYLTDLAKQPLPAKIEEARAADYELRPVDRPIILRTFMRSAGTHAIAVGFPERVNIAVDAERGRLAAVWSGRFLDAQGTWFIRSAPPAEPLGEALVMLRDLPDFMTPGQSRPTGVTGMTTNFRGYRLDDRGVPTFQYRFGSADVEDTIEPDPARERGLLRRVVIRPADPNRQGGGGQLPPLLFRVISGQALRTARNVGGPGNIEVVNEAGWRVQVDATAATAGSMRTETGVQSWILSINPRRESKWELRYSW